MENLLLVQKTLMNSVAVNENVIFDNVILNDASMTYNLSTGVITLNEAGNYLINWWIANKCFSSGLKTSFSIVSSNGAKIKENSPIKKYSF